MNLNADFSLRAVAHAAKLDWTPSPMAGVDRRMLDRVGDEVARATSIVRYAPGGRFSPHVHTGGEEFLVLEGVFSDEHGDFPAGSYIRNPPQSRHTPGSEPGCVIFVKLWQFDLTDRTHIRADLSRLPVLETTTRPDIGLTPLYRDASEDVRVETWPPNARIELSPRGGIELLALEGGFEEGGESFVRDSWLRLPVGAGLEVDAGPGGAKVWVKEINPAFPAL